MSFDYKHLFLITLFSAFSDLHTRSIGVVYTFDISGLYIMLDSFAFPAHY